MRADLATGLLQHPPCGRAEDELTRITKGPITSSGKEFRYGGDFPIVSKGPVTVSVSGNYSGGPIDVRVVRDNRLLRPQVAHFDPSAGSTSFSYTFVGQYEPNGCHRVSLEWRSSTGAPVTLRSATFVIDYHGGQVSQICE